MGVDSYIEALLFYKSASLKKPSICKALGIDATALQAGIGVLRERLTGGIRLIETDTELRLATAPELADFFQVLQREEVKKDIGKAGAETLAIVLYRGPVSRAEIDSIRGVNSATIVRTLLVRGLVVRQSAARGNGHVFSPAPELLAQLGVTHKQELPEYSTVLNALDAFAATQQTEDATQT